MYIIKQSLIYKKIIKIIITLESVKWNALQNKCSQSWCNLCVILVKSEIHMEPCTRLYK